MKIPKHIKDEVDKLRRHNAEEIKRLSSEPRPPVVSTMTDWQDRMLGRNGKLHINQVMGIYR